MTWGICSNTGECSRRAGVRGLLSARLDVLSRVRGREKGSGRDIRGGSELKPLRLSSEYYSRLPRFLG